MIYEGKMFVLSYLILFKIQWKFHVHPYFTCRKTGFFLYPIYHNVFFIKLLIIMKDLNILMTAKVKCFKKVFLQWVNIFWMSLVTKFSSVCGWFEGSYFHLSDLHAIRSGMVELVFMNTISWYQILGIILYFQEKLWEM